MNTKEAKKVGKKIYVAWKVFLWVLRWLSIILFGVLFFVGLYFKLPPKVLACIAVIPVVGIFVPKKIQPWVWGALTLLLLSVWGWVHLPEQNSSAWRPYEYTDELDSIEKDYFPADQENAADVYSAVLAEHGETIFYFHYKTDAADEITFSAPWDPNTYPFLDFWLTKFDPAIRQLVEGARIEQCRFEIPYNLVSQEPQLKRINQFKGWARLLIRSANRDLFVGDQAAALEKLLAVVGIAQHLYQQQTLFDQAAAFHVELLGARALESLIVEHNQSPEVMARIEHAFIELDPQWAGNWKDILLREKLMVKNLAALMYEVNDADRVRISHRAMLALQEGLGFYPRRLFANQEVMNRLAVVGLWLSLPTSPGRLAKVVDERFDHYSLQVQRGTQIPQYSLKYIWIKGLNAQTVIDWLAMQKVGYFWALDGQYQRHQAIVHQVRIISALKKYYLAHNQWPQQLAELGIDEFVLIDPLNGKPFAYQQDGEGFVLYSFGVNGVDDGGQRNEKDNKDDIRLWPRAIEDMPAEVEQGD